jgi:hypothetical protein
MNGAIYMSYVKQVRIHSHVMSLTRFLFGFFLSHSLLVSPSLSLLSLFSLSWAVNRMLHFKAISLQILYNQKLKPYFMCRYFYASMSTFNIFKSSFRYFTKNRIIYISIFFFWKQKINDLLIRINKFKMRP